MPQSNPALDDPFIPCDEVIIPTPQGPMRLVPCTDQVLWSVPYVLELDRDGEGLTLNGEPLRDATGVPIKMLTRSTGELLVRLVLRRPLLVTRPANLTRLRSALENATGERLSISKGGGHPHRLTQAVMLGPRLCMNLPADWIGKAR